jgi:hypothetical protein
MNKFFGVLSFTFLVLGFSNYCFAEDLTISQFPDNPREGQEVKMTLESDKYNLNKAEVTWLIDGAEYDKGVGRKTLILKAPNDGLSKIILVRVEEEGLSPYETQKVFEANTNFILFEGAESYVPSFYKGRRLPTKESTVRAAFFSFRNGEIVGLNNNDNETYTWIVNNQEKNNLSGKNKIINNLLTKVTDSQLNVRVIKEEESGSKKLSDLEIPLHNTDVVVYKTDEKKLIKQVLRETEVAKKIYLLVEPYFFSVPNKEAKDLVYTWKVNDVETKILTPWSVFFSGKEKDTVRVNLDVINNRKISEESSKGFILRIE